MFDDTTRKIYRILYNKHQFDEFYINVVQLARVSLRTEKQVKESVNWLVRESYINWNKQTNTFKFPYK